jgi:hypothetical protein
MQLNCRFKPKNLLIMKNIYTSEREIKNLDQLISILTEKDILCLQAMSCVRGGEGEGNSGEPVIIIPPDL